MALFYTYSGNVYGTASAGQTTFALTSSAGRNIPYLLPAHIHVSTSVDDQQTWVELARPADWNFDAQGTSVVLASPLPVATELRVQRITPTDEPFVDFQASSLLTAEQLNEGEEFSLYVDQELRDAVAIDLAGALIYKGAVDLTVDSAPLGPVAGWTLYNTGAGVVIQGGTPGWDGIVGTTVEGGEQVIFSGTQWEIAPERPDGVVVVNSTAPITVNSTDPQRPVIGLPDATGATSGAMSAADKAKLDTLSQVWTRTGTVLSPTNAGDDVTLAGKLGVGISAPSFPTHISAAKNTSQLFVGITGLSSVDDYAQIGFGSGSNLYGSLRLGFDDPAGVTNSYLSFYNNNGSSNVERMRITSAGLVGIGTGSPSAPVTCQTSGASLAIRPILRLENTVSGGVGGAGVGSSIDFYDEHADGLLVESARIASEVTDGNGASRIADLAFYTTSSNAGSASVATEKARITGYGDVNIGGTLPASPNISLKADGSATFAGDVKIGGTNISLKATDGSSAFASRIAVGSVDNGATFTNSYGITAYNSSDDSTIWARNSKSGKPVYTGVNAAGIFTSQIFENGSATFAGTVTATVVPPSDARFKENITPANPQLADVVALGKQLKNFDWNDEAPLNDELRAVRQLGLIAQEAERVSPGIVKTIKRTKRGKELTPEKVIPAVYKEVVDPQDEENFSQELVTPEQIIPATYEEVDDSFKGISHDALIMKLLGAVAELSAEVKALKAS